MGRFASIAVVLGMFTFGFSAPQSVAPVRHEQLEEAIGEFRRAMSDVGVSLSRIKREDINDEQIFLEGQRRRLRGILAVARCIEAVNDGMPASRDKAMLAACLRSVSVELSQAAQDVRSIQSANDHGHTLFASKAFQPLDRSRDQPNVSVRESIVP